MKAFADYDVAGLRALVTGWGHKGVHARRVLRAFYDGSGDFDLDSIDMGAALRERLRREVVPGRSGVLSTRSRRDGRCQYLIGFGPGGGAVEAVLMPGSRAGGAAGCVSSQVGCAMGCDFCASTRGGLERNLDAGEIVEQFLHLRRAAASMGRRLTSLVFMGMGEPMHNLDNVIAAIERIAGNDLGSLGWRQVTVSTVGVVPGIERLAGADLNVNLAVSLHAPDDATRSRIVPTSRRFPVAEIIEATKRFALRTGRVPTVEYCLLAGVNDSEEQAHLLADLFGGEPRCHVNLIPYNPIGPGVSGAIYGRPSDGRVSAFLGVLRARRLVAHVRHTRGDDV